MLRPTGTCLHAGGNTPTAAQIVISRTSRPGPKHSRVDVGSQTYRTAVALTSALTLRH